MKDLIHYLTTHPGIETQNSNAASRMRCAIEGETAYLPAMWLAYMESIAVRIDDENPYFGSTDVRAVETLGDSSTLVYGQNGHTFTTKGPPTAHDQMMICGARGLLIAETAANGGAFTDAGFVFQTQLQVSNVSATGLGFAVGLLPPGTTTGPEAAAPANGVWVQCTSAQAALTTNTVSGSGSVNSNANLNTTGGASPTYGALSVTAATDLRVTIQFGQSPAGNTWGNFYVGNFAAGQSLYRTPFTAAQLTDVAAMITAANVYLTPFVGFRVASTTQRSAIMQYMIGTADR